MKIYTDIDLSPNIQKFLPLIKEDVLFYKQYELKHPSALYNLSLAKIDTALKDFLEIYKRYYSKGFEQADKENTPALIKNYQILLYCFREHLDDCFTIVKSFIPVPANEKLDRNQCSWLIKNAKDTVEEFFKNIDEYKKYLDSIVNELKHNNGSLSCIAFYEPSVSTQNCLGYFVANVVNGVYEPIEKVHEKVGKTCTGFSFRRDLTYNLVNIYNLSEEMMLLLENKLKTDFKTLETKTIRASEQKRQVFKDLMEMPRIHFLDEYSKPTPSVSLTEDGKLKLEYPSMLSIKPNRLSKVVVSHCTDGHTREFRIPYM